MAKKNKAKFDEILRPICLSKGNAFKALSRSRPPNHKIFFQNAEFMKRLFSMSVQKSSKNGKKNKSPALSKNLYRANNKLRLSHSTNHGVEFIQNWKRKC